MVKKSISLIFFVETLLLAAYFISVTMFANLQVAFLSSLFIILGSSFAYKKMVQTKSDSEIFSDKRDLLDDIEDPHGLYDDEPINNSPVEELDLKEVVKQERAKIKTFDLKSIKHGLAGGISLYRIVPYIFLILGFISLKNNALLELSFYLPALLVGIVVGSLISQEIIS